MSTAPTTSSCAETPSGTYCVPPCAYPCFDDYLFTATSPCEERQWGCMCGRPDAYKNTACCFGSKCSAADNDTAAAFQQQFCTTFNHSASLASYINCQNWTAPPVPPKPTTSLQSEVTTSSSGSVIGGAVGGVAGALLLISLGGYFLWRRRAKKRIASRMPPPSSEANRTPELSASEAKGRVGVPELGGMELGELGDTQRSAEVGGSTALHPKSEKAHHLYELDT